MVFYKNLPHRPAARVETTHRYHGKLSHLQMNTSAQYLRFKGATLVTLKYFVFVGPLTPRWEYHTTYHLIY